MAKDFSRTDRISEQIRRELAELIRLEVKDPRVRKVTLTGVEVTNDHAHAKVFYTSLEGGSAELQQGLERASGFLRSQIAHAMKLRVTPQLLVMGLVYALVMGFIGGIFPAVRAARLPIPTALRQL